MSSLPVFSLFPCSKKGDAEAVRVANEIVGRVKKSRIQFLEEYFSSKISPEHRQQLSDFIPATATLVPLPKSAPLLPNSVWPGNDICQFMVDHGWGRDIQPLIRRATAVPKAAFQAHAEDRPTVQVHFNSMDLDDACVFQQDVQEFVLIDDVVTQGRTAYAAFLKLQTQFPHIPVKLFALIRSDSFKKIEHWCDPASSEIKYYPASGKTFHNMEASPLGGLWG
jgi:hypothetical protein